MKKFLVGIIFIIPIIVVLALNATGAIIQRTTPVNPTGLDVRDSGNSEIGKGDVIKVDINDTNEFIIVEVLPTIAKNREISYERDEDAGDGEVKLERIGSTNRYSLVPVSIGSTKITIRAKANINAYKEVSILVTSNKLQSINVYDASGKELGVSADEQYEISGATRFYADIYPAEALSGSNVEWQSSVPDVAVVSENGVVMPVGHGVTEITVRAKDKNSGFVTRSFAVSTATCVAKSNTVYSSAEVNEEYIRNNYALSPNDTVVTKNADGSYTLTYTYAAGTADEQIYTQTIKVEACEEGAVGFADDITCVYTRNGVYYARIADLASGNVITDNVTYSSSNPNVLGVGADGLLEPVCAGEATIRVTYNGRTLDRVYTVKERPVTFELTLGSADAKLGIQLKRVWGFKWLQKTDTGYSVTDKFAFGIYGDSGAFDVAWSVDNEEYASLTPTDGNGVYISFKDAAKGQKITLTAAVIVDGRVDTRAKRSFTFEMRSRTESVNVYDFDQVKYVNANMKCNDFVLQNDIYANAVTEELTASIYGNGFKWDASGIPDEEMNANTGAIYYNFWEVCTILDEHGYWADDGYSIDFDDLIVINAPTLEESVNRGSGIRARGIYKETLDYTHGTKGVAGSRYGIYGRVDAPKELPVNVRYCQIYNTDRGIEFDELSNATVEGCILGDNNNHSLLATYPNVNHRRKGNNCELTLRNNVIKQSQGPAIIFMQSSPDNDFRGNYAPKLTIDGCLDIYNWKEEEEFIDAITKMVFQYVLGYVENGEGIINFFSGSVSKIIKEAVGSGTKGSEKMYYGYAGKKYVSMGIFECGAMYEYDKDCTTIADSAQLATIELNFCDESGKPLTPNLGTIESILKNTMNVETIGNTSYIICPDFTEGEPEIMPGDPVPNSIELYSKLRGGNL